MFFHEVIVFVNMYFSVLAVYNSIFQCFPVTDEKGKKGKKGEFQMCYDLFCLKSYTSVIMILY